MRGPNVLVVLIDDMGFGASTAYGGPCRMPTAERLADEGLRYTRFHVTSLCSPTRQSLLTGRNHHSVGMGVTTEMSTTEPGYCGRRPASAATMGQVLHASGYATAAFGKWHQTPPGEVRAEGPFTYWPTGEGFEHYYGFMGAEMNHWYPQLYAGTTPVEPTRTPEEGYHLTEDLVDHCIEWLGEVAGGERPFFGYLALGATHAPFHVAPEWIDGYRGEFDAGWDAQREQTLERQRRGGIVPPEASLAPWSQGVPHWDELDPEARRVAARFMETYAGFAEHTDVQVGRVIDALDDLGVADDTLVIYLLGDNGASGEGGIEGTLREHLVGHGYADTTADMATRLEEFGSESTYGLYPAGWALAMNTPYQWTKQIASHYGGTRDGMIIRWPAAIADPGGLRHQWHHVIDVLPTVLEAAAITPPEEYAGVAQQPIEGVSMAYTFTDAEAPDRRRRQYFEMIGNRAVYDEGWIASARHGVPWEMTADPRGFDEDVWQLYDTTADWSQSNDLADAEPERLARLQALFESEAERYQVLPLDDRVTERENPDLAGRADPRSALLVHDFTRETARLTEEVAPNVKNRSHTITASVEVAAGDRGVLIAQGGRFGGWSFYLHEGRLCYAYNLHGRDLSILRSSEAIAPGERSLSLRFAYDGGPAGSGASVTLSVDGAEVGAGRLPATTAYYFSFDETLNVGIDRGTATSPDYQPLENAFTGTLTGVRLELDPTASVVLPEHDARAKLTHQ